MGSQAFFPILWENFIKGDFGMETFGERLKALRKEMNLGQIALAKKIGVGKSVISLWELNKSEPTLSNLVKLALFFNVSTDYLAGLED